MLIDLTSKETRKADGFVKIKVDAPDGRFGGDWQVGGITYKVAKWEAKKYPEMITTVVDEKIKAAPTLPHNK